MLLTSPCTTRGFPTEQAERVRVSRGRSGVRRGGDYRRSEQDEANTRAAAQRIGSRRDDSRTDAQGERRVFWFNERLEASPRLVRALATSAPIITRRSFDAGLQNSRGPAGPSASLAGLDAADHDADLCRPATRPGLLSLLPPTYRRALDSDAASRSTTGPASAPTACPTGSHVGGNPCSPLPTAPPLPPERVVSSASDT